jgi:flavin-dependent dehydrogenase
MNLDALVVGAGPAGCAAAARLAGDGAKVAMLHHPSGGHRHSESLPAAGTRALVAAGLGPVDTLAEGRCRGTLMAWGSNQLVGFDAFASPDGAGWWIDRARFDSALRHRCAALGVAIPAGRIRHLHRAGQAWVARIGSGPDLCAPWVIDATGRAAAVARRLGAARRGGPPLVAVHARTLAPSNDVVTRIVLEAEADGWWYVGASSHQRIGAVRMADPRVVAQLRDREHFVARLVALPHLGRFAGDAPGWSPPQACPAGGGWLDVVCGEGWIACGDAALAFDPLSGQGLLGALASGVAAAQAISSAETATAVAEISARHAEVRAIYQARRQAAYAREHRWPDRPFWSRQRRPGHQPCDLSA